MKKEKLKLNDLKVETFVTSDLIQSKGAGGTIKVYSENYSCTGHCISHPLLGC